MTCEYCRRQTTDSKFGFCQGCGAPVRVLPHESQRLVNAQMLDMKMQFNARLLGLPPMDYDYLSRPLLGRSNP